MVIIEIFVVVALILTNGLLAMAELAVVSARRGRLQVLINQQVRGARRALALASDSGRFLSTVQIGITLVGVFSGAFSGATLGVRLAGVLAAYGVPQALAEQIGIFVVVVAITYASLIVGELVPKQIALRNPEGVAAKVAPAMTLLAKVASPLVSLLDFSGDVVLRIFGFGHETERKVTDEEVRTLISEAETAGVIEPGERAMISGVMRLSDRLARAVMTPRREVEMINIADPPAAARTRIKESAYSRFPVYDSNPDEMIGVVQAKDLLDTFLKGETPDLRAHICEVPVVPDTADALGIVSLLKSSSAHMVLVHDEYGHFEGIITPGNILEAIIGPPPPGVGEEEFDAVERPDGSWLIPGSMAADEMAERLSIELPHERSYQTAAGFVLACIGHIPRTGESVDAFGCRFEVVDLDGLRIDKILARRLNRRAGAGR